MRSTNAPLVGPLISVIIPALNEARYILGAIGSVERQDEPHEVIVVDGGSWDGTPHVAAPYARVLNAPTGRALQMNVGAREAVGDILLFLHADTHLPDGALSLVRRVAAESESGAFRIRFDTPTPLLRFYSFCTRLDFSSLCFGDRALFVRREIFGEMGGFPDVPLFEDLELVRRLHKRKTFAFLNEYVTTSSRRFLARGPFIQQLRNTYLWLHFLAGSDPQKLTHMYPYGRS